MLTGVGAAVNSAGIRPGQSVAVVGLGGVGLNAVLGALVAGAGEVVALDLDDDKLALAESLGATLAVNSAAPDAEERVRVATGGGVDVAIEMAGSEQALAFAYAITRRGGLTVTGGLAHPERKLAIPQVSLVAEERTLRGSYVGSCVPVRDVARYAGLFRQGRLPVDRLLSPGAVAGRDQRGLRGAGRGPGHPAGDRLRLTACRPAPQAAARLSSSSACTGASWLSCRISTLSPLSPSAGTTMANSPSSRWNSWISRSPSGVSQRIER